MNICLINTSYLQGGAAIACLRLKNALQDVNVSLLNKYNDVVEQNVDSVYKGRVGKWMSFFHFVKERLFFLPYEKEKSIRFNFSPANTGVDISNHPYLRNADVLHLHWINAGFLSLKNLQQLEKLNKPIVWTLHDMWAFTGGCHHSRGCLHYESSCGNCPFLKKPKANDLSNKIHEEKERIYAGLNMSVVTPSNWLASCAKQSSLFKNRRIEVIPNPIDTSIYKPTEKKAARLQLHLKEEKIYLAFIAANVSTPFKGVNFLRDALRLLNEKHGVSKDQLELLVIGKVKDDAYDDFVYPVHLAGVIRDEQQMVNYYNAADVFVLPSLEENLPNTIMEAMACGTPAVAFDTGGIPDLIDDGKNGLLARYKSAEDMAAKIYSLISNKELLGEMSNEAVKKVKNHYSKEIIAEKYINLYRSLMA